MDKRVIFAVAGSGKTTLIVNKLCLEKKSLIITYTNNNLYNLRGAVLKKWGYVPSNIKILSYYHFLYSHCYRPFLQFTVMSKGINWNPNPNLYAKNDARYIDSYKRLYSNRIAKFLAEKNVLQDINNRLKKYFDIMYVDEVQDFAGNDFNLLKSIASTKIDMLLVGDFYQHTYDTSRDGKVNGTLHSDYANYKIAFVKMGFSVDTESLIKSHRCSPTICDFITTNIGIEIKSHRTEASIIKIIDNDSEADEIFYNNSVVKLFYQEHYKYNCYSRNWGESKGEDKYEDVCVVLNEATWKQYSNSTIRKLPPQTINKLYVACSRAKRNLYIVNGEHYKKNKKQK